jgi:hypothetical protein
MLNVVLLNVVMLSAIMLSVVAPEATRVGIEKISYDHLTIDFTVECVNGKN